MAGNKVPLRDELITILEDTELDRNKAGACNQILSLIKNRIEPLSDEEIQGHYYKVSTSPEPYTFTEDDGTLVNPNTYNHVRVKELLKAQVDKIKGVLE